MVATNGDELDVIEPDWLEIESRQIDALGPKFAALVDTLMREMGGVPEKREEMRRSLYSDLQIFGNRSAMYQDMDDAKPGEWLKRIHHAARKLKELLDDSTEDGWPKPDAELADLPGRLPDGVLSRFSGDLSRLVAVTKDPIDICRPVGRRSHGALHQFVADLAETYKGYTGKKAGRSRRRRRGVNKGPEAPSGPFFRLVKAALSAAGVQMSAAAIDSLIGRVIKERRG
jgi:hypothetical protein